MKILYIAKHGQLNNDDEGAIYKGLTLHDCSVDKFDLVSFEDDKKRLDEIDEAYDYVLFHKLPCEDYVEYVCNKWDGICWYFDPINKGFSSNDKYVSMIKDNIKIGFFTDGDFVKKENKENLRILRQGLDDCVPTWSDSNRIKDFSFIGTTCPNKNCSCGYSTRSNYITRLQSDFKNWKPDITNIYWKESLTKVCHLNKIMLAMPPATDLYWSNRLYLLAGRGAFVLHPESYELKKQFGENLAMYKNYEELKDKINYYINNHEKRNNMAKKCQSIIVNEHSYFHRCKELSEILNDYR
tara:strand:- start:4580 stop:5470 length:891 start_codon:yes stop_codon:yes gene_type:complete